MAVSSLRRRGAAALSVLLWAVAAAPASAQTTGECYSAQGCTDTPRSATSLVNSVGVNVHLHYSNSVYENFALVRDRLRELGVKHIRDQVQRNRPDIWARLNRLASDGIKANLFVGHPRGHLWSGTLEEQLAAIRDRVRGATESVEGPNEYDWLAGDSNWPTMLRWYQNRLYSLVKGDPSLSSLKVLGPSLVPPSSHRALGDISGDLDYGNIHSYPGHQPPHMVSFGRSLSQLLGDAAMNSKVKPVMSTETGYHNAIHNYADGHPPVSEEVAGLYATRLVLEYFRRGVARAYLYELFDVYQDDARVDVQRNLGLLRNDGSPKPAFTSLKNLLSIFSDVAPKAGGTLSYSITGSTTTPFPVHHELFQKSTGEYFLAIWKDSDVWDGLNRRPAWKAYQPICLRIHQPVAAVDWRDPERTDGVASTLNYDGREMVSANGPGDYSIDLPDRVWIARIATR